MNDRSLDNKQSSPLHWACYFGFLALLGRCENAVNYLLAWKVNVNIHDGENKFTPLHLAVLSGNSKIVRKLLMRGANVNALDIELKKPINIAIENGFDNIKDMLEVKDNFI